MDNPVYTEEDFKKLLKSIVADKKREREDAALENRSVLQKKFLAKLGETGGDALQEAFLQKTQEIEVLKGQIEKVKPAIKKLMEELKVSKDELEVVKKSAASSSDLEERLKKESEEKAMLLYQLQEIKGALQGEISQLKEELARRDVSVYQKEIARLEYEVSSSKTAVEEERQHLKRALKEKEDELARRKELEEREIRRFEEERQRLVEKLAESLSQMQRQSEMIHDLREEASALKMECGHFEMQWKQMGKEAEDAKGRLSHSVSHFEKQLQAEIKKQEELKVQFAQFVEESQREKQALAQQLAGWEKREVELAQEKEELQKTDQATLRAEFEEQLSKLYAEHREAMDKQSKESAQKFHALEQAFVKVQQENGTLVQQLLYAEEEFKKHLAKKENAFEETLTKGYAKMRELSQQLRILEEELSRLEKMLGEKNHLLTKAEQELRALQTAYQSVKALSDEKDSEIRKAQQHLAKKVKESTILQDLLERQKMHTVEVQKAITQQKSEIERLQGHLSAQRMNDEKMQEAALEKIKAAEGAAKEWQEKYVILYQEGQQLKGQLLELQKIKKQHDQLSSTMTSLRQFLKKTFDVYPPENEDV